MNELAEQVYTEWYKENWKNSTDSNFYNFLKNNYIIEGITWEKLYEEYNEEYGPNGRWVSNRAKNGYSAWCFYEWLVKRHNPYKIYKK